MKKIKLIIICLLLCLLFYSSYNIYNWNKDNKKIKNMENKIKKIIKEDPTDNLINEISVRTKEEEKLDYKNISLDKLKKINNDTIGFLTVNGTNINYPIVQTNNNDYYLNYSFDKTKNKAGWIFLDYRNNINNLNKNTIIYGHARKDGTLFGSLKNTLTDNFFKNNNHLINIKTQSKEMTFQIFSVYIFDAEKYYLTTEFNNNIEYNYFLETIKKRSIYDFNTSLNENDYILTLSTCLNLNNKRIVVHAKLI